MTTQWMRQTGHFSYRNIRPEFREGLVFAGMGAHPGSSKFVDSSLLGNDGTLIGGPQWVFDRRWGMRFDGSGHYADLGTSIPFSNRMWVSGWTSTAFTANWQTIIGNRQGHADTTPFEIQFQRAVVDTAIRLSFANVTGGGSLTSTMTPAQFGNGVVRHIYADWDGATIRLFIDGQFDNSKAFSGAQSTSTQSVKIGRNIDGEVLAGDVYDVLIGNGVILSPSQITALYHQGLTNYPDMLRRVVEGVAWRRSAGFCFPKQRTSSTLLRM